MQYYNLNVVINIQHDIENIRILCNVRQLRLYGVTVQQTAPSYSLPREPKFHVGTC